MERGLRGPVFCGLTGGFGDEVCGFGGLGDSGALTWLEFNDSLNFGPCFGAKADLGAHAPLACGRPCLIAPPRLRKFQQRNTMFKNNEGSFQND